MGQVPVNAGLPETAPLFCRFGRTAVPRYNAKLPRDLATPQLSLLVQDVAQTGRERMEIQ
jgi:hypothetical protein